MQRNYYISPESAIPDKDKSLTNGDITSETSSTPRVITTNKRVSSRGGASHANCNNSSVSFHEEALPVLGSPSPSTHRLRNASVSSSKASSPSPHRQPSPAVAGIESSSKSRSNKGVSSSSTSSSLSQFNDQNNTTVNATPLTLGTSVNPNGTSAAPVSPSPRLERDLPLNSVKQKEPPRRLMARLNMGAVDRRKMQASNVMSSNHSASSFNGSAPNLRVKGKISCSEDAHDSVAMGGRSSSRTMKQSASALVVGSVPVPGEDERRRGPGHGGAIHASVGSPTRPLFLWRDKELTLFIVSFAC